MIDRPQLPPIEGRIEVEVNGKRVYQKVQSPGEVEIKLAIAELAEAQSEEIVNLQLAIAELAEALLGGE